MFLITKLLLRYNNPELSLYLSKFNITPELYATSWFVTLFTAKISKIENTFFLWKEIIREKDTLFPCYLAIALLEYYQQEIKSTAYPNPAQAISRIIIHETIDLRNIISSARKFKDSMPQSWKFQSINYNIFNLQTVDTVIKNLSEELSLIFFSRELIQRAYENMKCTCEKLCFWCQEKSIEPIIIIDCRPEIEQQAGVLPNCELIDQRSYQNLDFLENYIDRFAEVKGKYHFVLLGSSEFVSKGCEPILIEHPMDAEEMIETLYFLFFQKGFPYVSIVEGGFKRCHDLVMRFSLEIKEHTPDYCLVCNPNGPRYQAKMKNSLKKITKSMGEVFKSTFSRVLTGGFNSFSSSNQDDISEQNDYSDSKYYLCRKFDKTTNDKSDEEFSLLIMKKEVILGRYANHQPKKIIKIIENLKMTGLLKITSMKKFPNVLTFFTESKHVCLILESIKAK